jgi:hypothetical protein
MPASVVVAALIVEPVQGRRAITLLSGSRLASQPKARSGKKHEVGIRLISGLVYAAELAEHAAELAARLAMSCACVRFWTAVRSVAHGSLVLDTLYDFSPFGPPCVLVFKR